MQLRFIGPSPLPNSSQPHHPTLHLWLRLMSHKVATHHHYRLFSQPVSKNCRQEVSRLDDTASLHQKSFRIFSPSHPCPSYLSLFPHHWFSLTSCINSKPKKRQLGYLRTLCFVVPSVKPLFLAPQFLGRRRSMSGVLLQALLCYIFFVTFVILHRNLLSPPDKLSWRSLSF